jgi:hypothetical protein
LAKYLLHQHGRPISQQWWAMSISMLHWQLAGLSCVPHAHAHAPAAAAAVLLQVKLQFFSSLHLYNSKVLGDNAMYAITPNSTWRGQPWTQVGDYRASPGGALPAYMGAQAGVQLGTYPMRVMGFGLDARVLPAAGCKCKKPARVVSSAKVLSLANVPTSGDGGSVLSALSGLV